MIEEQSANFIDVRTINFSRDHIPIIPQICNDIGYYGAGYSGAISERWPIVEKNYREWFQYKTCPNATGEFSLGQNQYVNAGDAIIVNMIAQFAVRSARNYRPIKYEHLDSCLSLLNQFLNRYPHSYKIYLTKIGTGLAGGHWDIILPLILKNLGHYNIVFLE